MLTKKMNYNIFNFFMVRSLYTINRPKIILNATISGNYNFKEQLIFWFYNENAKCQYTELDY